MTGIMIIDDNRDLAESLGMILRDEGYAVTLAFNGSDGIAALEKEQFDVILVDHRLPDTSGVQLFQSIRKKSPDSQIFMITGHRIEQIFAEVTGNAAIDILRSPFEPEQLLELLRQESQKNMILVPDCAPGRAARLSAYLTDAGVSNLLAVTAREAVDGILTGSADTLLLDMHRSVLYGLEVYLDLQQLGRHVNFVLFTDATDAVDGQADVLQCAAITGCLYKPFRPEQVLHTIRQHCTR